MNWLRHALLLVAALLVAPAAVAQQTTASQIGAVAARRIAEGDITGALTFMPVQQGTGVNQHANAVKLGWNGTALAATVDNTDFGAFAFQSWVAANYSTAAQVAAATVTNVSGVVSMAHGGTGSTTASDARSALGLSPVASSGAYGDLVGNPVLGSAAALNVGTGSGTVAAGDDSRITGALSASAAALTYQPTATLQTAISIALSGATSSCALAASGNVSVRSTLCIQMTDGSTGTTATYVSNLNLTATSAGGTGDKVGLYSRTISASGSAGVWSMNTVMDILPRTGGAARAGSVAGYEMDIDNTDCDAGLNPGSNATCPTWGKGLWITGLTGNSLYAIRDAILVTGTGGGTLAHYGLNFLGAYIDYNTIYDGTNSTVSVRIAGSHTDGIDMSWGGFSEAAIKFNGGQKLCYTADCLYETHFDGTAGALDLNANGALIQFSPTGIATQQQVGGGTLVVYGTNGNGFIGNGNGAIGWNLSAGQGEIDFTNNAVSSLPGAFAWYRKASNGTQTLLATLSSAGAFGVSKLLPASIEMGLDGAANTPDIKFHSGATASTYDARISVAGGNGSQAMGTMGFEAGAFLFAGSVSMPSIATCATETRSKYLCLSSSNTLQVNP